MGWPSYPLLLLNTPSSSAKKFLDGHILLIDKPLHWTSFDAVNKIRYALKKNFNIKKIKVGHAGTLDPLATGLLIICTGKATKQINNYMGQEKEYIGTITLGGTTPSYDLETEVDQQFPIGHINPEMIEKARQQFLGEIQQVPPIFSAIKKEGQKAYELARQGEDVKMQSRPVQIHELELFQKSETEITFRVICSKGTYIRSLAHDIGKALNSGAHLSELRRTRIGEFSVEDAIGVEEFVSALSSAL